MASTTEFGWDLPDVGSDDNTWGDILNAVLQDIEDKIVEMRIPVGGLYLSTTATNPATSLGYGSWSAYAAGRALVGVGNNGQSTWTGGETRGAETHTLTTTQLPAHAHSVGSLAVGSAGSHTHTGTTNSAGAHTHAQRVSAADRDDQVIGPKTVGSPFFNSGVTSDDSTESAGAHTHTLTTDSAGSHTHSISGNTGSAGSGAAHNNIQPSIAVYVWRRTA